MIRTLFGKRTNMYAASALASHTPQHFMDLDSKYVCPYYASTPIVIDRGERCYMYDTNGTKYFDLVSGFSALNQGHCHPKIV